MVILVVVVVGRLMVMVGRLVVIGGMVWFLVGDVRCSL